MSDHLDRLLEFQRAWTVADRHYVEDISAAKGDASLIQRIEDNWWRHQANWSMAATAALARTNAAVIALHADAKAGNDRIDAERKGAKKIATLVRDSSAVAGALTKLLSAVASATGQADAA